MSVYLAALVVLASPQAIDTSVAVARGDRVIVEQLTGQVTITGWDRDEVEVRSADGEPVVGLQRRGSEVRIVRAEGVRRPRSVTAAVRVPRWIALDIGSPSLGVSASGVGAVRVANVSGDVRVEDVEALVDVRSIRGEIVVVDARGGVRASSQSDDVTLRRVAGEVYAHSLSGDIVMEDVRSRSVRVEALDGDVSFSGTLESGGDYAFFVHDGDATIQVPPSSSARVSVSTFDGDFESEFPVRVERLAAGQPLEFVLGSGEATVCIEVFDGEIRLLRRP